MHNAYLLVKMLGLKYRLMLESYKPRSFVASWLTFRRMYAHLRTVIKWMITASINAHNTNLFIFDSNAHSFLQWCIDQLAPLMNNELFWLLLNLSLELVRVSKVLQRANLFNNMFYVDNGARYRRYNVVLILLLNWYTSVFITLNHSLFS